MHCLLIRFVSVVKASSRVMNGCYRRKQVGFLENLTLAPRDMLAQASLISIWPSSAFGFRTSCGQGHKVFQ